MTATPKETADASNISYFGDPIYTYSLKQGIEDGFLAPYEKWLNSLRKKNQLGAQFDDYDVIRKVAYGKVLLTKQARIEKAKQSDYLVQYPEENRQVLRLLLDEYAKSGTKDLS